LEEVEEGLLLVLVVEINLVLILGLVEHHQMGVVVGLRCLAEREVLSSLQEVVVEEAQVEDLSYHLEVVEGVQMEERVDLPHHLEVGVEDQLAQKQELLVPQLQQKPSHRLL